MDVLSDVLGAVRLTGAVYFDVRAREPWAAGTPATSRIRADVMPGFDHVISFHLILDGGCWAQLADQAEAPARLEAGDAVILPDGTAHYLSTEPGKAAEPDFSIYYRPKDKPLPFVLEQLGGDGAPARFVCGYLGCEARPFNPIIGALPRLLVVRGASASGALVNELVRVALLEHEHPRAGGETILSKLSELMFLQAVRQHLDDLPDRSTGWLAGLRDRHVGAALRMMHGCPEEAWTVDALARGAGLSRSVFAERFAEVVGAAPMQYLGNWRLQCAARLLERQSVSIAQAAAAVGYESEAAFNRAFKKRVGLPPGAWRRTRQAPPLAAGAA